MNIKEDNTKETSKIYGEYFSITKEYKDKYGEKTVLLMQVGSFFEIYGIREQGFSEIEAVAQICQFNISEKKAVYKKQPILMAGFPDYRIDKYLQKIVEGGFTAVVFVQEKNEKNTKRIFHSVHSPGTFVPYEIDSSPQITNHIMCIWMENHTTLLHSTPLFVCGISIVNIYTGKSSLFQYQTPYLNNPSTFDELERSVSELSPSEVILISPFEKKQVDTILQYAGIKSQMIHRIDSGGEPCEKVKHCSQQKYIKTILSSFYGDDVLDVCLEFNQNEIATQSFCFLLDFLREHNPLLIKKIDLPVFNQSSDRVLLLNHTIQQLNIIPGETKEGFGHLSSVLTFLNKCSCAMGKRLFATQLLNPTFCEEWLEKEYDMIELMRSKKEDFILEIRKNLGQIKDIEKICRQMVLQKLYPASIYHLFTSIQMIERLCSMDSLRMIQSYLVGEGSGDIENHCQEVLSFISHSLQMEKCRGVQSVSQFDENIICPGVSSKLDALIEKDASNCVLFLHIREHLNQLLNQSEKTTNIEYVKEHVTEKSGKSLVITKKRGSLLKNLLSKVASSPSPFLETSVTPGSSTEFKRNTTSPNGDSIFLQIDAEKIKVQDIKIVGSTTSNDEITFPLLDKTVKELLYAKEKINQEMAIVYRGFIEKLENQYLRPLETLATYVSRLDVLICKTHVSQVYHFCRPIIDSAASKSRVEATGLRHLLIEHINTNEIYVPNDCDLGKGKPDGILLLGINMAGKSSYIKSVGVAVIMAQSGCFVPADKFHYKPYQRIFSRIVSNDNLFKNLSLFAVEMTELRTILKNGDRHSLVLLDELSNGSETQSSVSILMATLMHLCSIQSSFICSTHFHEVLQMEELQSLLNLVVKHLYVYYDRALDALVYDRRLKEGSGPSSYGLEVCKSLYFPVEFLDRAVEIRNKYHPENEGILSKSVSPYNAQKIRGLCEICQEAMGEDIHHLREQKTANDKGIIDHFHKNHLANLINICEKCHQKEHLEVKKIRKTKTTKGFLLHP
jgi:DNA mismatch repair protein MutS